MTHSPVKLSERFDLLVLLGGLSALSALSMDIMLPGLGLIARDFAQPEAAGSHILASYFAAFAVGQVLWGLLSDAYGRRPMLHISLLGFLVASVGCALATSFEMLIICRVLQGLTAGATPISRAMARDVATSGTDSARVLSVLLMVTILAPILAPIVGAAVLILFDWRMIFAVIAIVAALLFVMNLKSGFETIPERRPERLRPKFIAQSFAELMHQKHFRLGLALSAFAFGGYGALLSNGSIVLEAAYGVTPSQFSVLFALAALFVMAGSVSVRMLVARIGIQQLARIAMVILFFAACCHGVLLFLEPGLPLFWAIVCLYLLGMGIAFPLGQALAVEHAAHISGFAASLVGAGFVLMAAFTSILTAALFDGSHRAISMVMLSGAVAAMISYVIGAKAVFAERDAP